MGTPTFGMGFEPTVPLEKALRLAAELEDDELTRKLASHRWMQGPAGPHIAGPPDGWKPYQPG